MIKKYPSYEENAQFVLDYARLIGEFARVVNDPISAYEEAISLLADVSATLAAHDTLPLHSEALLLQARFELLREYEFVSRDLTDPSIDGARKSELRARLSELREAIGAFQSM